MSEASPKQRCQVAVLVFEGVDALDFAGPIEVLTQASQYNAPMLDEVFAITIIAQDASTTTASSLKVKADMRLADAWEKIAEFDILVVPGATLSTMQRMTERHVPEIDLVRTFALSNAPRPKILLSICTGALLLGAAGVLSGMTVTTHHDALDALQDVCSRNRGCEAPGQIVHRRFVDGGFRKETKLQIITTGGISSGIDATFYILCRLTSPEGASCVSRAMEYGWREPNDGAWPVRFQTFG